MTPQRCDAWRPRADDGRSRISTTTKTGCPRSRTVHDCVIWPSLFHKRGTVRQNARPKSACRSAISALSRSRPCSDQETISKLSEGKPRLHQPPLQQQQDDDELALDGFGGRKVELVTSDDLILSIKRLDTNRRSVDVHI